MLTGTRDTKRKHTHTHTQLRAHTNGHNRAVARVEEAFSMSDDDFEAEFGFPKPSHDDDVVLTCRSGMTAGMTAMVCLVWPPMDGWVVGLAADGWVVGLAAGGVWRWDLDVERGGGGEEVEQEGFTDFCVFVWLSQHPVHHHVTFDGARLWRRTVTSRSRSTKGRGTSGQRLTGKASSHGLSGERG